MKRNLLKILITLSTLFCMGAVQGKNIIFMIGDGMGFDQVLAAAYYEGAPLSFESFPYQAECTTYSANASVTDSAAAATALATGYKVNNGVISLATPGDDSELLTLLEDAKSRGKRAGLVTTTYMTHATPAAFGAHEPSRNNLAEIAIDYLEQTRPNVLFGGGANGMDVTDTQTAGYQVVTDTYGFFNILDLAQDQLSAQFGSTHLPYEFDSIGTTYPFPHLSEMVPVALDALNHDPDGFFLMVEGGRIDHACHNSDLQRAVHETIEFSQAVQAALDWVQLHSSESETLILVTADHETGGLTVTADNGPGNYPSVTWSGGGGHTGANVPVYALGKNADQIGGVMDNTELHAVCAGILNDDNTPPIISDVAATDLTDTTALIGWTTDESADSLVDYGLNTGYGSQEGDTALTTSHAVLLTGLDPNTTYHYQVSSKDASGNTAYSPDANFTTDAPNTPPVAYDQPDVNTAEDTPVDITLVGSDGDNDPLTYHIDTPPDHGTLNGTPADPTYNYTPDPNYNGSDTFTFVVNDGTIDSAPATVTIAISAVNDPPTQPQNLTAMAGDQSVTLSWLPSTDPEGQTVVYHVYRSLVSGTYTDPPIASDLTDPTYTDTGLDNGTTYFYIVRSMDTGGLYDDSTEASAVPSATAYDAYVEQDPTVSQGILGGDGFIGTTVAQDGLVQTIMEKSRGKAATLQAEYILNTPANPAEINGLQLHLSETWLPTVAGDVLVVYLWNGTAWEDITANIEGGSYWVPNPQQYVSAEGNIVVAFSDSLPIKGEDVDTLTIDLLYAHITVGAPVNQDPVAVNDSTVTAVDTAVIVDVLANDSDPENDPLTVVDVTQPTFGTAVVNPDETVTYTPTGGNAGNDSFTYTISDGQGGTATGTVSVFVSSGQEVVYVYSIDMGLVTAGKNVKGQATVRVYNQSGQPQEGATVYGEWLFNGTPAPEQASGLTDANGEVALVSPPEKAKSGDTFTFTVTDIVLTGFTYNPDLNNISGDSIAFP